jgi:ABC-type bacteriocin/lantibiotic exporter with double-glycine peptidase domain
MVGSDDIALRADNLSLALDGKILLEDFSFKVPVGHNVLITGPSGCGKSTVLKCFLGLTAPRTGSVTVSGQPLTATTVWSLRRQIAYVTQEPDLGTGNARQVIDRPFHYRANAHLKENLGRLGELMDLFGLGQELLDKSVSKLSGGEKQRIALIVAILLDRPILLLDEPTSALDMNTRKTLGEYLQSRTELTVLIVAHDTDIFAFADNIVQIHDHAAGGPA